MKLKNMARIRVWHLIRNQAELAVCMDYCKGCKILLGAEMIDGRRITSIGFEGSMLVISAS